MRLFSLVYIAASHAVHVHYFSCVLLVVIHTYIYIYMTTNIYIYRQKKTRLSMTPVHRTVQEGLSMVSFRECITKSKHVF